MVEWSKFRDAKGRIGIIYSPHYGMGWLSFYKQSKEFQQAMMSDYWLVSAVLSENDEKFKQRFETLCDMFGETKYLQTVEDLSVEFMEEGSIFDVEEFDGKETIVYIGRDYFVA